MQLCSFSIAYVCQYHNLTATMEHSVHNVDISKPLAHMLAYMWSAIVRSIGQLPNSQIWHWRWLIVEKLTFNSLATALVDIPAVSMPIARSLKTWEICGIVLCDKNAHIRVPFYWPSTRCKSVMIMLFNQLLDMPHLSGGWIILANEECTLTGI